MRLAMLTAGIIGQGENPNADEAQDALMLLNDILDEWATDSLTIYTIPRTVFTYPSLQQVYTLGPGGDFNMVRPVKIEKISLIAATGATASELPVEIVNFEKWSEITVKQTSSPLVQKIWVDYANPLINLTFWPIPNQAQQIAFYTWQALTAFTTVGQTLALPPGYRKALRYKLARELRAHYGREADVEVNTLGDDALGKLKNVNSKTHEVQSRCDSAVVGNKRAFNYLTGE